MKNTISEVEQLHERIARYGWIVRNTTIDEVRIDAQAEKDKAEESLEQLNIAAEAEAERIAASVGDPIS